jgi:hypothetical protein
MLNDMRPRRVTTILLASLALLAAGCGGDDGEETPAAPANGGSAKLADAITFELTGGDAFRDDAITVEADGGARIQTRVGEQRAELTPEELSQLSAQAEDLAGAETAVTRPPQPDMVSYRFTYRGREVKTDDPAMPEELAPLIRTFVELIERYGPS